MPNRCNIVRFQSPRTGRWFAGGTVGHRAALGLTLAGMLAVVVPPVVEASSPGASVKAGACTSCAARRQSFQRARQAILQEGNGPGALATGNARPNLTTDTAPHITLPTVTDVNPADAPQRPAGHKAAPE
jgi:hypothetical protein